jgi:divalent metal cation (Fe/Co/Zn/Cd) transporter
MNSPTTLPCPDNRAALIARGRKLEYFTLGYNLFEGLVAVGAALLAGSVALLGFGVDSFIESLSGAVLLWRLHAGDKGEAREQAALRWVGVTFLLLAAYIAFDGAKSLLEHERPEASYLGIGVTVFSLFVMPVLARAKRKVGIQLGSRALQADARQTDICVYLSYILLAGLGLNALLGWWWADPVAALLMVPIIAKEGIAALRGQACDCSAGACH